jgi:hypothetical protein
MKYETHYSYAQETVRGYLGHLKTKAASIKRLKDAVSTTMFARKVWRQYRHHKERIALFAWLDSQKHFRVMMGEFNLHLEKKRKKKAKAEAIRQKKRLERIARQQQRATQIQ